MVADKVKKNNYKKPTCSYVYQRIWCITACTELHTVNKQDTVYCSLKNLSDQPIFQTNYSWGSGTIFIAGPADLNVFAGSKSIKLMGPYPSPVFYYLERKKIQRLIQKIYFVKLTKLCPSYIIIKKKNYICFACLTVRC